MLTPLAPDLWERHAPMTVMGAHLGHRMTVVRLRDGSLWVHSPVAYSPALANALAQLGPVAHVVAPNCMHDTYLEGWFAAYPSIRFHAAPDLPRQRRDLPFTDVLGPVADPAWAGVMDQRALAGMPRVNEVVFLHRPSRTLLVADLTFNLGPDMPWLSKLLLRMNDCYCKFGPSRVLKSTIKDRAALRASLDDVLAWDFERIVVGHGTNVLTDGRARLREAFAFL